MKLRALLLISASLFTAVLGSTCIWDTAQCGGKNYTGLKNCCNSKSVCTKINDYYSKCIPGTSSCSNKEDSQCGGVNFKGNKCCPSGLTCTFRNEWFSKCMKPAGPTPKPTTSSCSNKLDSQCGGLNWKGNTCCPSGLKCTVRNEWFSKCMASSTTPSPTPKPTTSSCSNKTDSQCGGKTFTGQTCCPSPLKCTYRNEWFSKCMAPSSPTPSPTTTKPVTSKPSTAKPTSSVPDIKCPSGESPCGGGSSNSGSNPSSSPDNICCNTEEVCMKINGNYGSYSICIPADHPTSCDASLCKNGGTITCGSPGNYGYEADVCSCSAGWGGGLCDKPFTCVRDTETACGNGNLASMGGTYGYSACCSPDEICTKFLAPTGSEFSTGCWTKTVNTCSPSPCKNGGKCTFQQVYNGDVLFTSSLLICQCATGFYGDYCENKY